MHIPGPSAAVSLAMRGVGSSVAVGMQLLSLPTRAIGIVERTEVLLTRVEMLVGTVERVAEDTKAVVAGAKGTVAVTAATVAAVEPLLSRSAETIAKAADFAEHGDSLVARAGGLISESERMLGEARPLFEKALPPARRFVEQLTDREVDAAIAMVDEFPELAARLKNDIVPILATLDGIAPNVTELVRLTDDVRQAILGIPGFGLLRRRGAEKLEEEEAEEPKPKKAAAKKAPEPEDPMLF
ncbi:MAG: hypothetical protein ACT4QG_19345 [Sporichthyaceae bacterium]